MTPRRVSPQARRRAARIARALSLATRVAERRFVREVTGIMAAMHTMMVGHLEPAMRALVQDAGGIRKPTGSVAADVDAVVRHVVPQIGPKVGAAHKRMTDSVDRIYKSQMKEVLPIGWQKLPSNVQAEAARARDASIGYVEKAARAYAQDVRELFDKPELTQGARWEDLRDALIERGNVSESRAELIARDQTLKLNAAVNKARQQAVGLDSYIWSTSGDERVREEHAALDGKVFSWAAPPEPGHPGEDYQCRCVAIPVIAEAEDD